MKLIVGDFSNFYDKDNCLSNLFEAEYKPRELKLREAKKLHLEPGMVATPVEDKTSKNALEIYTDNNSIDVKIISLK